MSFDKLSSLTGGGGLKGGDTGPSSTGYTAGAATTGATNINIGGNPNVRALSPLLIIGGVFLAVWAWRRFK